MDSRWRWSPNRRLGRADGGGPERGPAQLAGTVRPLAHSRKKATFSRAVEAMGGMRRSSSRSSSVVSGALAEKAE